jgi:hypothetical protein
MVCASLFLDHNDTIPITQLVGGKNKQCLSTGLWRLLSRLVERFFKVQEDLELEQIPSNNKTPIGVFFNGGVLKKSGKKRIKEVAENDVSASCSPWRPPSRYVTYLQGWMRLNINGHRVLLFGPE